MKDYKLCKNGWEYISDTEIRNPETEQTIYIGDIFETNGEEYVASEFIVDEDENLMVFDTFSNAHNVDEVIWVSDYFGDNDY